MSKLSSQTQRAKYQYNKKYQDRYWEKKGAQLAANSSSISVEVSITDKLLPDLDSVPITVAREKLTDDKYIRALETANKTLSSENRRLIRLLIKYQDIIRIGIRQIENENF